MEGKICKTAKSQIFFLQKTKVIDRSHCHKMLMRTEEIKDRSGYPYDLGKYVGTIVFSLLDSKIYFKL